MTDMPQETPQAAPTVARKIAPRVAVLDATSPAPETSRLSGISSFQYLLLTGCVVALGLMATRALFGALPTSHASTEYRQATAALDATLDEVRQAMLAGQDLPEPADATVAVTEFPGPFRMLRVESRVEDALISAVVAAGSFRAAPRAQPATPDDLPRLSADTVNALLADPDLAVRRIRHDTQLSGESVRGLLVVSPGVSLTLRDVVLIGAVVSEAALSTEPLTGFNKQRAPTVLIEGVLRTEPMPRLPGVSLVLPDGVVTAVDSTVSLSLHGAVVAHDVSLHGSGSLFGQVASVSAPDIASSLEHIASGRVPRTWPSCLDMRGALRTDFIAYLPDNTRWADVQDMIGFTFP